ncbi:velvet factor-domain-containing protein [Clohesyomyces aquaticus]|uniref:Velvet factor-domain-containing protein n=1 Tax=Clohesyomyces aquaticus TaxID=1231657 RepID=A0A1Y1ZE87_9PLEO|nr:velvet factor-domain-containing protein [Clohesyomyces aquaticus]
MYHFGNPHHLYQAPAVSSGTHLRSEDVSLELRQQPKEALVTTEGKEKARKPVDPPPILQLTVKPSADPAQNFLQSPYLFMCVSLWHSEKDEPWDAPANKTLAGSLVSSLHRLKDINNKDGGFFVFGDISIKIQGKFRLNFSLYDLRKETNDVQFLTHIVSEPFRVLLPKDFKGMEESTYLSRAFSDQGVRLRLRKEPRSMMGTKRGYSYPHGPGGMPMESAASDGPHEPRAILTPSSRRYTPYSMEPSTPNLPLRSGLNDPLRPTLQDHVRPAPGDYAGYGETQSPAKRFRTDPEDRKEQYPDHSGIPYTPSYALQGLHNMGSNSQPMSTHSMPSNPLASNPMAPPPHFPLSQPGLATSMSSHQQFANFSAAAYNPGIMPQQQQPPPLQYPQMYSSYNQNAEYEHQGSLQ